MAGIFRSFGPDPQSGQVACFSHDFMTWWRQGDWGAGFGPHKKGKPDAAGGGTQPWTKYVPRRPGDEKHSHQMDSDDAPNDAAPGDWKKWAEQSQPGASDKKKSDALPWSTYGPDQKYGDRDGKNSKDQGSNGGGFDWQV